MGLRPSVRNVSGGFDRVPAAGRTDGSGSGGGSGDDSACRCQDATAATPSSSSSSPPPPQREAWTARGQLLLDFHNAISRAINSPEMARRCSQIGEDMSRAEKKEAGQIDLNSTGAAKLRSMADEYGAEAAMIVENKSKRDAVVRNKSLALGLFSFVALRGGRGAASWAKRTIASRSSYQLDNLSPKIRQPVTQEQKPVSRLRQFFWFTFDATVSVSITLFSGTFLFMPRPTAYIDDMSKLPLVEGKSVYAEMVCPPLLREYRRVVEKYGGVWPVRGAADSTPESPLTQEDASLNIMRKFAENCSKRSKYEHVLLEERKALSAGLDGEGVGQAVSRLMRRMTRGGGKNDDRLGAEGDEPRLGTVSVPSPGVPDSIYVDVDLDVFALVADDEEETMEKREEIVPTAS